MSKIKVFLISSTRPPDKSAAAITLDRHLSNIYLYDVQILLSDCQELFEPKWLRSILHRLEKTRFSKWVQKIRYLLTTILPLHLYLPQPVCESSRAVVITVACGNGWITASKYACKYNIPLVVRFDDWWPDSENYDFLINTFHNWHYTQLANKAALCLCISDGMLCEVNKREKSAVILPIPEGGRLIPPSKIYEAPFRVCYLGNMYDYGPMLAELAESALDCKDIRIEFRGNNPRWPNALKTKMKTNCQLHDFQEGSAFDEWYQSFDCYLVAMFFDMNQRRRVKTCFATKLLDYSAMGRPIVIWGPEESSVVVWARKSGAAYCVTNPDPSAVVKALVDLANDQQKCSNLGKLARRAYETEFSADRLQKAFDEAITQVAK
jgi:glycosyltransferase involved in cell wall biosynthesis